MVKAPKQQEAAPPLVPSEFATATGYYDALIAKWPTVPGTTQQQKLDNLNAEQVTLPKVPMIIPTYAIYNVMDPAEFSALTSANQQNMRDILAMGNVDLTQGQPARNRMIQLFGAGTATRTAMATMSAPYDAPKMPWWQATVAQGGGGLSSTVSKSDLDAAGLS